MNIDKLKSVLEPIEPTARTLGDKGVKDGAYTVAINGFQHRRYLHEGKVHDVLADGSRATRASPVSLSAYIIIEDNPEPQTLGELGVGAVVRICGKVFRVETVNRSNCYLSPLCLHNQGRTRASDTVPDEVYGRLVVDI